MRGDKDTLTASYSTSNMGREMFIVICVLVKMIPGIEKLIGRDSPERRCEAYSLSRELPRVSK